MVQAKRKVWSEDEDYALQKLYKDTPSEVISFILDRPIYSIYKRSGILGLKKDPEWLLKLNQGLGLALYESGKQFQFKKGNNPMNKGLKQTEYMSTEMIERTKATRFKKGQPTHNELYDGAITIHKRKNRNTPPYKWIRISKGKMRMLHIVNWEKENGPVPEGFIVAFKTPDTMNCEVSNLELITRQENMRRNTIHRYPQEIKKTIRLLSKVKKKIKQHAKQN